MYGQLPSIKLKDNDTEVQGRPIIILSPPKQCVLRLPTNKELTTYLSAQYSIVRAQGGAEDVPTPKADKLLFDTIRLDKSGEEFDDAEISYALTIITRHRMLSCEREGQTFVVTLGSDFGELTHTLSIPTLKQMAEYRKSLIKTKRTGRGVEEWRYPVDVPVGLYDTLLVEADGYSSELKDDREIPVHHKRTVVDAILTSMSDLDPNIDPNS